MTVGMAFFCISSRLRNAFILMFGIGLLGFMLMGPDSLLAGVGAIDVVADDRLYWQQGLSMVWDR